ncbi:MAG: hypothetical protein HAW66_09025 [Shewanella sp.]|nr:hypothetical protein [Shewanella sp.]
MLTHTIKKSVQTLSVLTIVLGLSFSAQAAVFPTDISSSLEQSMTKQTTELLKMAKTEIMLSIETQLAEMMHEMSTTTLMSLESDMAVATKKLAKVKKTTKDNQ